MKENRKGW